MSKRTDLYIVGGTSFTELAYLACKLSEKITSNRQTALFVCQDEMQMQNLDELMWSFKNESFIPHRQASIPTESYPIVIKTRKQHQEQSHEACIDNLVCIGPEPIENEPKHDRKLILVNSDQHSLSQARTLFKAMKSEGLQIHSHDLR
jgi:DNA polymerase-3 subunit chi